MKMRNIVNTICLAVGLWAWCALAAWAQTTPVVDTQSGTATSAPDVALSAPGAYTSGAAQAVETPAQGVKIVSTPSGAQVVYDGLPVGTTPFLIDPIVPGRHTLEVVLGGYQTQTRTFDVYSNKGKLFAFELVALPADSVVLAGQSAGAEAGQGALATASGQSGENSTKPDAPAVPDTPAVSDTDSADKVTTDIASSSSATAAQLSDIASSTSATAAQLSDTASSTLVTGTQPSDTASSNLATATQPSTPGQSAQSTQPDDLVTESSAEPVRSERRSLLRSNGFYLDAIWRGVDLNGVGVGAGLYWRNVNAEFQAIFGVSEVRHAWQGRKELPDEDYDAVVGYKPIVMAGRIGYGFGFGQRLRLTPQAGLSLLTVSAELKEQAKVTDAAGNPVFSRSDVYGEGFHALSWSAGVRLQLALARAVGLYVTPAYVGRFARSKAYPTLTAVEDDIDGWANGFSLQAGLSFTF